MSDEQPHRAERCSQRRSSSGGSFEHDAAPAAAAQTALAGDVFCPRCGYNLRGVPEPRCPECGLRFTWDELNRWAEVPWLYETAPRGRRFRSWLATLRELKRPSRFWTQIPLTLRPVPRRLVQYWALTMTVVLVLTCAMVKVVVIVGDVAFLSASWLKYPRQYGSLWADVRRNLAWWLTEPLSGLPTWPCLVIPPLYVIATLLALAICLRSLLRLQIRFTHVLRVVVYASGSMILWPLCIAAGALILQVHGLVQLFVYNVDRWSALSLPWHYRLALLLGVGAGGVVALAFMLVMSRGFRHYARYERTWPMVLASQIIAVLVALNAVGFWLTRTFF